MNLDRYLVYPFLSKCKKKQKKEGKRRKKNYTFCWWTLFLQTEIKRLNVTVFEVSFFLMF